MRIAILHNRDSDLLEDDPGREARKEVEQVASVLAQELQGGDREVTLVPVDADVFAFGPQLTAARPDVVMNLCESLAADSRGEMVIPALLELLGIPYTGSGVMGSAIGMDKWRTKMIWLNAGIPTPRYRILEGNEDWNNVVKDLGLPLIVKPAREGSTLGLTKVTAVSQMPAAYYLAARKYQDIALAEEFISGAEYTARRSDGAPIDFFRIHIRKEHRIFTRRSRW